MTEPVDLSGLDFAVEMMRNAPARKVFHGATYYFSKSPENKSFVEVNQQGAEEHYLLLGNREQYGYRRFVVEAADIDGLISALQEAKERYFND